MVAINTQTKSEPNKLLTFTHGAGAAPLDGTGGSVCFSSAGDHFLHVFEEFAGLKPGETTVGDVEFLAKYWELAGPRPLGDKAYFRVILNPGSGNTTDLLTVDITSVLDAFGEMGSTVTVPAEIIQAFTVPESGTVWIGVSMSKVPGELSTIYPYLYCMNGGPLNSAWFTTTDADAGAPTIPVASLSKNRRTFFKKLELTSTNHIADESPAAVYNGTALDYAVPEFDGACQFKFEDVEVQDGDKLTIAVKDYDAAAAENTLNTFELDMGATNQAVWDGNPILLDAGEEGDTFDLCCNRHADGTMDWFLLNKSTGQGAEGVLDLATISHANKLNGDRTTPPPTVGAPRLLSISGPATINKILSGTGMAIVLGDSQSSSNLLGSAIPTAFGRIGWFAGIGGNQLTDAGSDPHTEAPLRYCHTTPGLGDLCSMSGVQLIVSGMGINDVAALGSSPTEAQVTAMLLDMHAAFSQIVVDATETASDVELAILGLPKIPENVAAPTADKNYIVEVFNAGLKSIAAAAYAPFFSPYQSSAGQIAAWFAGGAAQNDLHYNATGAAAVAEALKRVYDAGSWALGARLTRHMDLGVYGVV